MCDECSVKWPLIFDQKNIWHAAFRTDHLSSNFKVKIGKTTVPRQENYLWSRSLDQVQWPLYWPTDRFGQAPGFWLNASWPVYLCIHTYVIHDRRPLSAHGQCTVRAQSSYFLSTHVLGSRQLVNFALTLSLLRYAFLDLSIRLILVFQHVFSLDFSMRVSKVIALTDIFYFNLKHF